MKREGQISVNSKNMFPIIKKWLYSDKDIFLREIVSNGCDAIKKLESLQGIGEAQLEDGYQPKVIVTIDSEKKQLIVSDNGIGMTEDEVERYITQIAFSGAEEFLEKYKEKSEESAGIIGHFGLGFYSAFMVSDTVEIETLSYKEGAKPVHWVSAGEDSYEIEDGTRTEHGTTIIMNITEEEQEFLQESRIREILHKYCQFMPYEIYLNPHDEERPVYDKDGNIEKNEDGTEKKRIVKPLPINDIHPLWLKAPKDCTDEDYKAFYQKVFMDFNEPLFWIHLNVDYPFNLKGILYFPKQLNRMEVMPGQVKLYSNQVFVADNIKEIIPEFLLLLKGVIDCPDMPLNVSRSFLQNDGEVQKIAQHITKKVSDKLHQIFKNDRPSYEKYWNDISAFIKFGCLKDEKFYDRMKDILLFKTIDGEYKTLEEYPKAEGNKIYYVTDENLQAQYISMFKENGLTAAVLTHAIDPHFISLLEYKNPEEMKFLRIDADLGEALKVSQPEAESEDAKKAQEEENNKLIECVKACLPDEKLEYKVESLKATETPAVILLSEYARRIQDMNKVLGESFAPEGQVTLVLNSENEIVKKIPSLTEENRKLVCEHIYDLALMAHKPLSAEQMSKFIARNVKLLELLAE
ncbi:MAG: molecular chaperone HtpG [Negativibacillus massiliensis]|jgi:molecular chaperone HtpG|uniref:molecular chaperone HtpG n=1 Tax=Negativibacillus massiliensis TaxID=1871035 RepID=UPI00033EEFF5|nr:molecular chaperone HtpG [Negativibacillus massiliensis]MCI6348561.1 molecular chaperone HtpG [Negativibacillus massiliensis]MDY4047209.1 molecular chaperone HtpG [Negativibacillus massiliensis]CDA79652.1 aTPase/histidine kinase/DNA gyrase B/HSP90 domain protein [Clostridium sp. CAG:242]